MESSNAGELLIRRRNYDLNEKFEGLNDLFVKKFLPIFKMLAEMFFV